MSGRGLQDAMVRSSPSRMSASVAMTEKDVLAIGSVNCALLCRLGSSITSSVDIWLSEVPSVFAGELEL
jgi:hypothetical protein